MQQAEDRRGGVGGRVSQGKLNKKEHKVCEKWENVEERGKMII